MEMRATSVGPDLSRCHARIEKTVSAGVDAGSKPAVGGDVVDSETGDEAARATETAVLLSA
jgi:single-strand DNA-binding protein